MMRFSGLPMCLAPWGHSSIEGDPVDSVLDKAEDDSRGINTLTFCYSMRIRLESIMTLTFWGCGWGREPGGLGLSSYPLLLLIRFLVGFIRNL